nr:hypothetical protein [Tanacetum cinerariifolium]
MRINPGMKPKEPTYQVVLNALTLTTCLTAFLITAKVLVIYMHQFWATIIKHKASYQFKIDNKRFSVNVKVCREILNICLKIPGQQFDEPPSEEEALSFIRTLGHSREIKYITDKSDLSISSEETHSKKKPTKAKKDTTSTKKPANKLKPTNLKAAVKAIRGKGCSGIDEGTGSKPGVLDVPKYDFESDKESWGNSDKEDDDDKDDKEDDEDNEDESNNDENDDDSDDERTESGRDEIHDPNQTNDEQAEEKEEYDDERVHTPEDHELTDEKKIDDKENKDGEEDDEVTKELYKDVNLNFGKKDVDMTHDDQGRAEEHNVSQESGFMQKEEDAHVTLTMVHDTQKTKGPL